MFHLCWIVFQMGGRFETARATYTYSLWWSIMLLVLYKHINLHNLFLMEWSNSRGFTYISHYMWYIVSYEINFTSILDILNNWQINKLNNLCYFLLLNMLLQDDNLFMNLIMKFDCSFELTMLDSILNYKETTWLLLKLLHVPYLLYPFGRDNMGRISLNFHDLNPKKYLYFLACQIIDINDVGITCKLHH